jgi:FixJ family two-component response regulator
VSTGQIFLVDDDESLLRAMARVLTIAGYRVETFSSADAFLGRPQCEGPACLILDLQMPEKTGLELQDEIRRQGWSIPVIFLSAHGDVPSSVRAMREGAMDFLTKPAGKDELLAAVAEAIALHRSELEEQAQVDAMRVRFESLTPREREVCLLVAQGLLNKQIADQLGAAEQTVKIHRGRVMAKLQVNTVPELVRLVDRIHARKPLPPKSQLLARDAREGR